MKPNANFRVVVEELIAQVPFGMVTTYGDIAALAGQANASRVVGGVAHYGNPDLPWHRLVDRFGGLAAGFHGGREAQAQLLEQEGVTCENDSVKHFKDIRWNPNLS